MTTSVSAPINIGDKNISDIFYGLFNTHNASLAPTTLAGTPSLACYKDDGTGESTAGLTLVADFDSKTGLNSVKVDTSADGAFYATGHDFSVVVAAGTVNSVSVVGTVVMRFSLGKGVNVTALGASAQSATDLKDLADTGYDPATHLVAGVATLSTVADIGSAGLANIKAQVHAELDTTARAEQAQGAPAADASMGDKIDYIFQWQRNKHDLNKTTGNEQFYADNGTTVNQKRTASDDGTTASKTEIATGP